MRLVAIANQKGGVGKTATAVNLAAALCEMGHRCLLVDLDAQANATAWLGASPDDGLYRALTQGAKLSPQPTGVTGLDIVPASEWLQAADAVLAQEPGAEGILRAAAGKLPRGRWRCGLIDCPPALGIVTLNALVAASEILVPVEPSTPALAGVVALLTKLERLSERLAFKQPPVRFLVCRHVRRTVHAQEAIGSLRSRFGRKVLSTTIRETVKVREAQSHRQPVTLYDPKGNAAADYRAAAKEWAR